MFLSTIIFTNHKTLMHICKASRRAKENRIFVFIFIKSVIHAYLECILYRLLINLLYRQQFTGNEDLHFIRRH